MQEWDVDGFTYGLPATYIVLCYCKPNYVEDANKDIKRCLQAADEGEKSAQEEGRRAVSEIRGQEQRGEEEVLMSCGGEWKEVPMKHKGRPQ